MSIRKYMIRGRKISSLLIVLLLFSTSFVIILFPIVRGAETYDYVDSNTTDVDGSADVGTETSFANCQDIVPDSDYMNIQEADTGGSGVDEDLAVDGVTADYTTWPTSGDSPWLDADDGTNVISGNVNAQQRGWFTFADTAGPAGSGYTVVLYVDFDAGDGNDDCDWNIDTNGDGTAEFSGTFANPTTATMNTGTISGLDTDTEINNARLRLDYIKDAAGGVMTVDYAYLDVVKSAASNYTIDFEYNWSNADFDETSEEVCFYMGSRTGTEDLNVSYWTGSDWSKIGTISTTNSWTNLTATGLASATYVIRINGTSESTDGEQGNWNIDVIMLHTYTPDTTTWYSESFGGNVTVEISWAATWHSASFGGEVNVTATGLNWHSASFGGEVNVYAWSNWSSYWKIGHTSHTDINMDMLIDHLDTEALALEYGNSGEPGWIPEDVNDDGLVNYLDTGAVALDYGNDYR